MNNIINYHESINLLLISFEALDIYFFLNKHIDNNYIKYNKDINSKNENVYTYLVFSIYNLLYKKNLQQITFKILTDYCNNINSCLMLKYINRFEYIYKKRQYNKTIKNYINKSSIQTIAINNLYIIHEIKDQYGLYELCKYILKIKNR